MACNKISYGSKREANKGAKRAAVEQRHFRNSGLGNGKYSAYLCPKCRQWHLTTMAKAEIKQMLKRWAKENACHDDHRRTSHDGPK